MKFKLIIFDCDGVIVDSETIQNQFFCEFTKQFGLKIDFDEAMRIFKGHKMATCIEIIEKRIGRALPPDFEENFRSQIAKIFKKELKAVRGIAKVLKNIRNPFCVASNAPMEKTRTNLQTTNLLKYFEKNIFSAYEIGIWKPDPGFFLHIAKAKNIDPSECAIIDDSVSGIEAGIKAGMKVFGYSWNNNDLLLLKKAGATVIENMEKFPEVLNTK